jgi:Domain of unknown function (DUF4372)
MTIGRNRNIDGVAEHVRVGLERVAARSDPRSLTKTKGQVSASRWSAHVRPWCDLGPPPMPDAMAAAIRRCGYLLRLIERALTWRESLRDIEACLRVQSSKLYHLGFRSAIARNTLANANAVRDWRIYTDFAQHLIGIARRLYADDPLSLDLDDTVYALDSTTIDLC